MNKPKQKRKSQRAVAKKHAVDTIRRANGARVAPLSFGLQTQRMNSKMAMVSYLKALDNPWDYPPVRSGVDCGLPTAVLRAYYSATTQLAPTNGLGQMFIAYPRLWSPIYTGYYEDGSPSQQWVYNSSVLPSQWPQTQSAQSVFEKARVSAFSVRVTPIANATNDQGSITFALIPPFSETGIQGPGDFQRLPWGEVGGADDIYCTLGTPWLEQHPVAQTVPFRHGATFYWRPQDPNSFTFQSWMVDYAQAGIGSDLVSPEIAASQAVPFFAFCVSNTTSPQPSIRIEMVLHLEATIASEYDGVVANGSAPHVIPAAAALTGVRKVFGGTNEKSGHVGTSSGLTRNSGSGGPDNILSKVSDAVNTAVSVGGDVLGAADKFLGFGSSLLSNI